MKVKVLKEFRDKYTKAFHKKNEIIEITKERYSEINSTALGIFVEKLEEENAEKDVVIEEVKEENTEATVVAEENEKEQAKKKKSTAKK